MTSKEFDKIDNTFFKIEQRAKKICVKNDVNFYNYLGTFVKCKLFKYIKLKNQIELIKGIDFSDKIKVRSVLNKAHFSSKEIELELITEQFNRSQIELFEWLDKTKEPYFFILNPVYEYGAGISYNSWLNKKHGYKKIHWTGVKNTDILTDYFRYKRG